MSLWSPQLLERSSSAVPTSRRRRPPWLGRPQQGTPVRSWVCSGFVSWAELRCRHGGHLRPTGLQGRWRSGPCAGICGSRRHGPSSWLHGMDGGRGDRKGAGWPPGQSRPAVPCLRPHPPRSVGSPRIRGVLGLSQRSRGHRNPLVRSNNCRCTVLGQDHPGSARSQPATKVCDREHRSGQSPLGSECREGRKWWQPEGRGRNEESPPGRGRVAIPGVTSGWTARRR